VEIPSGYRFENSNGIKMKMKIWEDSGTLKKKKKR